MPRLDLEVAEVVEARGGEDPRVEGEIRKGREERLRAAEAAAGGRRAESFRLLQAGRRRGRRLSCGA